MRWFPFKRRKKQSLKLPEDLYYELVRQGSDLQLASKWAAAVKKNIEAIKISNSQLLAEANLAICYHNLGEHKKSADVLTNLLPQITLGKSRPLFYSIRGLAISCFVNAGDRHRAVQAALEIANSDYTPRDLRTIPNAVSPGPAGVEIHSKRTSEDIQSGIFVLFGVGSLSSEDGDSLEKLQNTYSRLRPDFIEAIKWLGIDTR